jgi:NAD+ kinase
MINVVFMKIAIYIGAERFRQDDRLAALISQLESSGCTLYYPSDKDKLEEGTDMLLSVGGDGTFLSAAIKAAGSGVPVAGINMGRMGFLSENRIDDLAQALAAGEFSVEERTMLQAAISTGNPSVDTCPYALNEMTVRRTGPAMLSIDVCVDGVVLPTYWGDGLVVSTSSGSTAYSLSVGGPITLPEAKVFIIAPIAPHNLNVRPLVVPDTSVITVKVQSRDGSFEFSADNRVAVVPEDTPLEISMAQFSLKRVRLDKSSFIQALVDKLYWGEDVRNIR